MIHATFTGRTSGNAINTRRSTPEAPEAIVGVALKIDEKDSNGLWAKVEKEFVWAKASGSKDCQRLMALQPGQRVTVEGTLTAKTIRTNTGQWLARITIDLTNLTTDSA